MNDVLGIAEARLMYYAYLVPTVLLGRYSEEINKNTRRKSCMGDTFKFRSRTKRDSFVAKANTNSGLWSRACSVQQIRMYHMGKTMSEFAQFLLDLPLS